MHHVKSLGFSLLEVLVTICLISLLAAITSPIYSHYVIKMNRLSAMHSLIKLANALEVYYLEHNTYKGATLSNLHFLNGAIEKNYRIHLDTTHETFSISAKPINKQRNDTQCATLTLHSNGEKNISGYGDLKDCW